MKATSEYLNRAASSDRSEAEVRANRAGNVERIAAIIGRETFPWSAEYKPNVKWPEDYTGSEQASMWRAAIAVVEFLQAEGGQPALSKARKAQ